MGGGLKGLDSGNDSPSGVRGGFLLKGDTGVSASDNVCGFCSDLPSAKKHNFMSGLFVGNRLLEVVCVWELWKEARANMKLPYMALE